MDLLHRLRHGLTARRRGHETVRAPSRPDDRQPVGFAFTRRDIRPVARAIALGRDGAVVHRLGRP